MKKIPEWNSFWLETGFGAKQTEKLDMWPRNIYAAVVATNQKKTMTATGPGCSPWTLQGVHALCVCVCLCVHAYI